MEFKNLKINFLGDSITEGCGASDIKYRYTDRIAAQTGALCRNYGNGGTRIARQQVRSEYPEWDLDFCRRAAEMDPDADVVFVFGGSNDFGHGDAPIGVATDRTPETFYGALHTLYRLLIEKYPDALIIIATPLHRYDENNPRGENGRKPQDVGVLSDYVKIIREVAEYYSLPVLDLYATAGIQPEFSASKEHFTADGLHPNDRGYERLADRIIAFLKQF